MPRTENKNNSSTDYIRPISRRIFSEVISNFDQGTRRALAIAPPATGKTHAAVELAACHLAYARSRQKQTKVLYVGSNLIAVKDACERISMSVPNGLGNWDINTTENNASIIGLTWRQLVNTTIDPSQFTFTIADDAHHSQSTYARAYLEQLQCPIAGFTNSIRHTNDTAMRQRRGSDLILEIGESTLKDFFGEPICNISYADLDQLGIERSVEVLYTGSHGQIEKPYDPRIKMVAEHYARIVRSQSQCKTLIHTNSIKDTYKIKDALARAIEQVPNFDLSTLTHIGILHSQVSEQDRDRIIDRFSNGTTPILVHCSAFDEGHSIDDLSLIVIASKIRSPHVYERTIGRIFHSDQPEQLVIDLFANPANLVDRVSHPGNTKPHTISANDNTPEASQPGTISTIYFGTDQQGHKTINTDKKNVSPRWDRQSTLEAISNLHLHAIGEKDISPTRKQIAVGASRGLCPPVWLVFDEHGHIGFFKNAEELASALNVRARQYNRSNLSKKQIIGLIQEQWNLDPAKDKLFSKEWLEQKCDGITLPFRYRTIVGNDTLFKDFTDLTKAMRLKGVYFRGLDQQTALKQLRRLYIRVDNKSPIATKNKPLTLQMIYTGSARRICASPYNLFQTGHGNNPIFPGGINEANRALGFTIFSDLSKQDVLDIIKNIDVQYWPDRRFPISQKELNIACAKGVLPFSNKHIVGEGKFWETKHEFDIDLGYTAEPTHYRSLRNKIRLGTAPALPARSQNKGLSISWV